MNGNGGDGGGGGDDKKREIELWRESQVLQLRSAFFTAPMTSLATRMLGKMRCEQVLVEGNGCLVGTCILGANSS